MSPRAPRSRFPIAPGPGRSDPIRWASVRSSSPRCSAGTCRAAAPARSTPTVDDEISRQIIAGPLEINCLACHDRDPAQDQAESAANVGQAELPLGGDGLLGFAEVTGSAEKMPDTFDPAMPDTVTDPDLLKQVPTVTYQEGIFDTKDNVFFDVSGGRRRIAATSAIPTSTSNEHGTEKWQADQDVHMTAGLTCVDCHREGLGAQHDPRLRGRGQPPIRWPPRPPAKAATSATRTAIGRKAGGSGAPVPEAPGHSGRPLREADLHRVSFRPLAGRHDLCWPRPRRPTRLGTLNVNKEPGGSAAYSVPGLRQGAQRPATRTEQLRGPDRAEQADLARLLGHAGGRMTASSPSIWRW